MPSGDITTEPIRARLSALPSMSGTSPELDLRTLPEDPIALFLTWMDAAISAGEPEPQTMTLSTVDASGVPDARIVALKDVGEAGWAFASSKASAKAEQIAGNPHAALTFWWQSQVRSVRVRGSVAEAPLPGGIASLWHVQPQVVEFWQGSPDRNHTRIVYTRTSEGWTVTS